MFDRWVQTINSAIKTKKKIVEPFNPSKILAIIKAINAANELTDTVLVNTKTTDQAAKTIKKRSGKAPHKTPAPVAIPFPPLRPKKGVNTCPAMAPVPIHSPASLGSRLFGGKNRGRKKTGKRPLRKSIPKTKAPIFLPSTLKALVVPTLPLPYSRISIPLKRRPATYAVGIDPSKNANVQQMRNGKKMLIKALIGLQHSPAHADILDP